jgi:D-amino peptidase
LVTGDEATCREATALLGDGVKTAAVKRGLGRFSARHLPPKRARDLIEATARAAIEDRAAVAPYDPGRPCEVEVELATPDHAEKFRFREGLEIRDGRRVAARADNWWSAWKRIFF